LLYFNILILPLLQEKEKKKYVEQFNVFVRHETLRVAVLHTLKNMEKCDLLFRDEMEEYFLENIETYKKICDLYAGHDGKSIEASLQGSRIIDFNCQCIILGISNEASNF